MLLTRARLVDLSPPGVALGDLRVEGGLIVERGPALRRGEEPAIDLGGQILMPGLVNAHSHLYSALARGLPAPPVADFQQALKRIWWPLDRSLDREAVVASAELGLLDALRCGTTTLVDHHASPSAIRGSRAAPAAVRRVRRGWRSNSRSPRESSSRAT